MVASLSAFAMLLAPVATCVALAGDVDAAVIAQPLDDGAQTVAAHIVEALGAVHVRGVAPVDEQPVIGRVAASLVVRVTGDPGQQGACVATLESALDLCGGPNRDSHDRTSTSPSTTSLVSVSKTRNLRTRVQRHARCWP